MAHKRLKQQSFHDSPPAQSRFSTLPEELRRKILDYYSFEDVARTGILSIIFSSTRNWSEHSQVVLDKLLFERRGRWIADHPSAWVDKVGEILNNHREGLIPIQKFVLHIPDMQYKWGLYINIWLSYLSSNSIKELSVDNCNIITYKLSSILFEWSELTRLMLRNCAFCKSFVSFQSLRFLRFEKLAFGSKIVGDVTLRPCLGTQYKYTYFIFLSFLGHINQHLLSTFSTYNTRKVKKCTYSKLPKLGLSIPSLVRLELVDCRGFRYLDIQAPKLLNFVVASATSFRMSRDDEEQMCFNLVKPSSPFIIGPYHSGSNLGFRAEFFFRPPDDTEVPEFEGFGPEGEPP